MASAWGPGPVFVHETILEARRWQVYATRSAFVLSLLAGMALAWLDAGGPRGELTIRDLASISEGVFSTLAIVQVSLVLLAAPAAAAGSICGDRARGTLAHMMVTDLSDREIVLGKLGARLLPVLAVLLAAAPVSALGGLMGGLDFPALFALFAETAAMAVFGVSLAMAASVRAERPREVLMAVYAVEVAWLMALPIWWIAQGIIQGFASGAGIPGPPLWFQAANPFVIAFAPYHDRTLGTAGTVAGFCGALLLLSAMLLGLTMRGLRRSALLRPAKKAARPARRSLGSILFPSLTGPSLDAGPVLWREWHRNRPSRWERRIWAGLALLNWGMVGLSFYAIVADGLNSVDEETFLIPIAIQAAFGFLMLSVAAPASLAEERVRGSLDVLMATPLASRSILAAKWWGLYRRVLVLAILPIFAAGLFAATMETRSVAVPVGPGRTLKFVPLTVGERAAAVALTGADFLASGAAIVSLGLALATWIPRLGRAMAVGVIAFFFFGIIWMILIGFLQSLLIDYQRLPYDILMQWDDWLMDRLVSISPIFGSIMPLTELTRYGSRPMGNGEWIAMGVIAAFKFAVAWGLFALAAGTFDRCLGRMPETARRTLLGRVRGNPGPIAGRRPILAGWRRAKAGTGAGIP
ncbi:ABC transporter permease [Tundrisphaera sp. TA3]|uniref:ABC transporter permease n=1 Tax=Tundrisphaera sp. TA3 TaxID=3435775 RepID=UPI003EBF44C0